MFLAAVPFALVGLFFTACLGVSAESTETVIDIAPNTLNIQSNGTTVTVQTDLACSIVSGASVCLK